MAKKGEKKSQQKKDGGAFISEVARYFMDFLETDFHRRRVPKRSVKFRNKDNLLVGLNLNKYPSFKTLVLKAINHSFDKKILNSVTKGVYRTSIPRNLLELVKLQSKNITAKKVKLILKNSSKEIEKATKLHKEDYEKAFNTALENISKIVQENLVFPFVSSLEKPLEDLDLGDENSIYLMEEELTNVLISSIESKVSETVTRLIAGEPLDVFDEISQPLDLDEIKSTIITFFEAFKVTDLFSELYEMCRNKNILDKQDFYLYFCDITFNKTKYPVFYVPFSLNHQDDNLIFEFDSQVYINKKALGYVVQEFNEEKGKRGSLKTASERIIYLSQHKEDFRNLVNSVLNEIVNFFDLDSTIDISDFESQTAKSLWTRISNTCYITLFDKSDEALVNDYEEILEKLNEGDSVLVESFNVLIEDFIHKNPESFNPELEEEWDNKGVSDRLVFSSPIPLNEEQLQILSAVKKNGCKYVTVEGPPGTGKSHTITAVVFDAILKNQSVLVLSDKKEALDVVEDKITTTMNKVRHDKSFQNPILRLGKTGSTYSQILATVSVENIKTHYKAVKKDYEKLESNTKKLKKTLKEDLEAESLSYGDINIREIHELFDLEGQLGDIEKFVDLPELQVQKDSAVDIEEFRKIIGKYAQKLLSKESTIREYLDAVGIGTEGLNSFGKLKDLAEKFKRVKGVVGEVREVFKDKTSLLSIFREFSKEDYHDLSQFVGEYTRLRSPIFSYFLKGREVMDLDSKFKERFPGVGIESPHKDLQKLVDIVEVFNYIEKICADLSAFKGKEVDYIKITHSILRDEDNLGILQEVVKLRKDISFIEKGVKQYPNTFRRSGFNSENLKMPHSNSFTDLNDLDFNRLVRYLVLGEKLRKEFSNIPELNYGRSKKYLEEFITTQMTYMMDKRLVGFYDKNRADAKTLRDIIRKKQKFPKDEFLKLKSAFPCILSGIRDYAEYVPLEPGIFDLVIIDEASQVSIAQAFPALLRAKKALILGDKKQFSNVKSAQARTATNREYLSSLDKVFKRNVSTGTAKLARLEKFNIKTSILEFFEFISNYHTQLLKHFRGYKETISYSNKYFYQNSLQVMKIRGKNVNDVLKFSFVDCGGNEELYPNTNTTEAEYIIDQLRKLKEAGGSPSVCIITPHTNQQKLLMEKISNLPERDYFFDELQLKVMTFDTCQGEERDIVFYSMVATEDSDRLWGVFIKDLGRVDIEEDGQIKAQRLNVGFSRAKECMHFVLSKPLEKYAGSIGEALRHYSQVLEAAKREPLPNEVDPNSPREKEVLNWITQTNFWRANFPKNILFKPQFELGKYLRQLDKTYTHPNYEVDFLLIYKDEHDNEHKIIIEYDGFEEHFKNIDEVNEFNYPDYYSDDDVYRQKVLEGYGYKFLRINRFNTGKNPIATIDKRIVNLIKGTTTNYGVLNDIHETIEGLQSGQIQECPKCKEIRNLEDFRDDSLITGYGRFCNYCKGLVGTTKDVRKKVSVVKRVHKICPLCGSTMLLRSGRYGKFYGCSRFPYCKGAISYRS